MQVADIVRELQNSLQWTREDIASRLGVSASAVARWEAGSTRPRAAVEGQLRSLANSLREERARYAHAPQVRLDLGGEQELRAGIDVVLRELREILHRRSRLSGRSEALDEVAKLLFSHVVRVANEKRGIGSHILSGGLEQEPALALDAFVRESFSRYLPRSISHEIRSEDFRLRIKPQEKDLASEIIRCFDDFSRVKGLTSERGIEAVDLLNEVFGKFLADSFVDEKQLGQYLTPTEIVRFMVQLALAEMSSEELMALRDVDCIKDYGIILDPSCGVASFLAEFVRAMHGQLPAQPSASEDAWLQEIVSKSIVGIDKSERMLRYALTNIAMFGIPASRLVLANSLSRESKAINEQLIGKVGLIITNPPFGAEFSYQDTQSFKIAAEAPRGKLASECLFIERYLEWLRPGGQLLAIVPDSVLTNQGVFARLREQIAPDVDIKSVVSLPHTAFGTSGTTTKTSILHLRKKQKHANNTSKAFIAMCNDIGYDVVTRSSHRIKRVHGEGQLPQILKQFRNREPEQPLSKWVENIEQLARWDATHFLALSTVQEQALSAAEKLGLRVRDVASLSTDRIDPRRGTGTFLYIEISNVDGASSTCSAKTIPRTEAPSRARKHVRAGDVLVSTVRPERRTIGVVPQELDGAVCSTGFAVLRPNTISSLVLASLLRTEICTAQLLKQNSGIAYPTIDEKCLPDIHLPVARRHLSGLNAAATDIFQSQAELESKRREFLKALQIAATSN